MSGEGRYNIDDLQDEERRLRPTVRLAHLLLRECLQAGVGQLRLVAQTGRAEAEREGTWQAIMAFPPGVYDAIVAQFKHMAGVEERSPGGPAATLQLRWGERDVSAAMTRFAATAGREDLDFRFSVGQVEPSGIV